MHTLIQLPLAVLVCRQRFSSHRQTSKKRSLQSRPMNLVKADVKLFIGTQFEVCVLGSGAIYKLFAKHMGNISNEVLATGYPAESHSHKF